MGTHKKHKEHKEHKKKKKHKHKAEKSGSQSPSPHKKSKKKKKDKGSSRTPEPIEQTDSRKRRHESEELPADNLTKKIKQEPEEVTTASNVNVTGTPAVEGAGAGDSLSIEETNKLRAQLGLKPLDVGIKKETDEVEYKDRPDVHKPAENLAAKKKSSALAEKLETHKEKKKIHNKLSTVKGLGESDSEDDSASAWVNRSRKIAEEKALAEKRAKMLQEMDDEFGVGNLLDEEVRSSNKNKYSSKDLSGLTVEHDIERFKEGSSTILTLQDKGVLDEDGGDTLVNVNIVDDERAKKNVANKNKKPDYKPWEETEFDEEGALRHRALLEKYDEEIEGEKKTKFELGRGGKYDAEHEKAMARMKAELRNAGQSLAMPKLQLAREFYTPEEVNFKKTKKKVRKIRKKQAVLTADDLLPDNSEALPGDVDHGSRNQPRRPNREETDDMDADAVTSDLSSEKLPDEQESGAESALARARRLLRGAGSKHSKPEEVADAVMKRERFDDPESLALGSATVTLDQTSEFCRTLGEIPTYGQSGNRIQDEDELLDFEQQLTSEAQTQKMDTDEQTGGWNTVDADKDSDEDNDETAPVLNDEPVLTSGAASALMLATRKGYLQRDSKKEKGAKLVNLQAKNFQIEDKRFDDIDQKYKSGRRGGDRYEGPTQDFNEMKDYKPEISLQYIDDIGRVQSEKEAFKYLSYRFHGRGPGKMKTEKKMKKIQEQMLLKQMASTDTPLQTVGLLRDKLEAAGSAHVVLTGANSNLTATSLKKT